METGTALRAIRAAYAIKWAFFVLMIGAIWGFAAHAQFVGAAWSITIVFLEVAVLGLNPGQCPLGGIAGRYTDDRRPNFDIYLPGWLAARTKVIFGPLFGAAIVFTAFRLVAAH